GDQLRTLAERSGVEVVAHQPGADPAAVVFDAIAAAKARGREVVLVDTAGRLHTKQNLMQELGKIRRVISGQLEGQPSESLLVLDAFVGANALAQARAFGEVAGATGVVLTKLDGSARGGYVFQVEAELKLPVKLVGVGEGLDDLGDFEPGPYLDALLAEGSTDS
ncbi:MAG: signal recognition particle-docking protein FtsY, partial [Candidatus Dormiibacterota bacterium]